MTPHAHENRLEQPVTTNAPRGLSWWGVRTVATLELRQRVRSTRWKIVLGAWFAVVGLVTTGIVAVAAQESALNEETGRVIFGILVLFVLFLGLLIAPTLTATSVNGDRAAGTLAVLQATTLSAWDIVVGKLAAAWLAALAFLAVTLPFLLWAMAIGGTGVLGAIAAVAMLAVILAVVCAIALMLSTRISRPAGSAVLTYVTVAALSVGTLIAFGISAFFVTSTERVEVYGHPPGTGYSGECELYTDERSVTRTERTAWLLGLNPFVMVADVAGGPAPGWSSFDPLSAISGAVRQAQQGPTFDECWGDENGDEALEPGRPYWPWSLAAYLALGAGSVVLSARRLTVPTARLARGTRIA